MLRQSCAFVLSTLLCLAVLPVWAEPPLQEIVHKTPVRAVAWSADGKWVATASQDGLIRLTDVATGKERLTMINQGPVSALVFSPNGTRLGVKTTGGALSLFDTAKGNRVSAINLGGFQAMHLAFSPDGSRLAAAGVGEHLIWNHTMGGASGSRMGGQNTGFAAISPDGRITAWGRLDGFIHCFDIDNRNYRNMKVGPSTAMAFGPKAELVAVAAQDKSVRLVEYAGGKEVRRLEGLAAPGHILAFSANGKTLAASSRAASGKDSIICVWDVASGRLRRRLASNRGAVSSLALSPDGRTLAVSTDDTKALLWNVALREIARPKPPLALSVKELPVLWKMLGSADYTASDEAFQRLAAGGDAVVPFLKQQVRIIAVPPVDYARIDSLLADLDAPRFQVRDRANTELAKYGELAENGLRKMLTNKLTLEVRRRVEKLLERVVDPPLTPDRVRALEAVELLGALGSPVARQVLAEIGRDALLPQIRLEAVEMLRRLQLADKMMP